MVLSTCFRLQNDVLRKTYRELKIIAYKLTVDKHKKMRIYPTDIVQFVIS